MPDKSMGGGYYNSGYGSKSKTQTSNKADKGSLPSWLRGDGSKSKGGGVRLLSGSGGGGGMSVAYKGTNLSSADRANLKSGLAGALALRAAVDSQMPRMSEIVAGQKRNYGKPSDRVGEIGDFVSSPVAAQKAAMTAQTGMNRFAAAAGKPYQSSLGDDMASGIESRVQDRVAAGPGPLRGVSTVGRSPMISPMAGQGVSGENARRLSDLAAIRPSGGLFGPALSMQGPDLPVYRQNNEAGRESRRENRRAIGLASLPAPNFDVAYNPDTLGPDYETGNLGPQSGPETMPDPAGSIPSQKYNVADYVRYGVNPSQERQPIPGFFEKVPGLVGGVASGLNWLSNLPGEGPQGGSLWQGSRKEQPDPLDPQTATAAPDPVQAAQQKPVGMQFPQFLYPEYTQYWAQNLPRGPYGRG